MTYCQDPECSQQGSRKWELWDPVGSDKTYLFGQNVIPTHGRSDTTHSSLDKPTADLKNSPADGTNFLEGRTKPSTISKNFLFSVSEVK